MIVYHAVRAVLRPIVRSLFRLEVTGADALPDSGPCIVAANHKSFADPVVLGVAFGREVRFIAKEELFRYPIFSWLIRQLGAFPVRRDGRDVAALRRALAILEEGGVVGVFVEGTRVRREGVGEVKPGVYLLARLSGAPVYLAAVSGTCPLFLRKLPLPVPNRVKVVVRRLDVDADDRERFLEEVRAALEATLASLAGAGRAAGLERGGRDGR